MSAALKIEGLAGVAVESSAAAPAAPSLPYPHTTELQYLEAVLTELRGLRLDLALLSRSLLAQSSAFQARAQPDPELSLHHSGRRKR